MAKFSIDFAIARPSGCSMSARPMCSAHRRPKSGPNQRNPSAIADTTLIVTAK